MMAGCSTEDLCGIVMLLVVVVIFACWQEIDNATEEGLQRQNS